MAYHKHPKGLKEYYKKKHKSKHGSHKIIKDDAQTKKIKMK